MINGSPEEQTPQWRAPALACDAHFHVFGDASAYPYSDPALRYAPPLAPFGDYLETVDPLGIERFVFVQPSAYGRDNRCMLDAMAALDPATCRGIVDIEEDAPDAELDRLQARGVRGVRINVKPIMPPTPGFAETLLPRIRRLDARCSELGWQLDLLTPGWLVQELLPTLRQLASPFVLAHMGLFPAVKGPAQQGFAELLAYLRHGDGRCWIKLTGVYRLSTAPGFADVAPMAEALIDAAPDRLIWGSDYPHLSFADKVGTTQLFNLLGQWAPGADLRRRIMVDNPTALFGF
jgi:2-pyrone-4,6-dicarboxylate lactonase